MIQILFTVVALARQDSNLPIDENGKVVDVSLSQLPAALYAVSFVFPLLLAPIQEAMKLPDKKLYIKYQKKLKLFFNTKLGMHSPV